MTPERKHEKTPQPTQDEKAWIRGMIERFDEMQREKDQPKQERRSEKQEGLER